MNLFKIFKKIKLYSPNQKSYPVFALELQLTPFSTNSPHAAPPITRMNIFQIPFHVVPYAEQDNSQWLITPSAWWSTNHSKFSSQIEAYEGLLIRFTRHSFSTKMCSLIALKKCSLNFFLQVFSAKVCRIQCFQSKRF